MFILTEKPSVAESIAIGLGGFKKGKGYYFNDSGDCIVSAAGHLLELLSPEEYDPKYKNWSLEDLPIVPAEMKYKPIQKNIETLKKIEKCFNEFPSENFILATDAEREGELIGALILNRIRFSSYENAKRFWVSEALTPEVVKKGIQNAKPLAEYESYRKAGYARQHADWLVGMNISRLLSVSMKSNFSFGRVQTAVLGAIYLRDRNIANYEKLDPKPCYFIYQVKTGKENTLFKMYLYQNNSEKFEDTEETSAMLRSAVNDIKQGTKLKVINISNEKKTENPPPLFNITGLQKYCSQKYEISPEETLALAQELYETHKCLSYPRTPSVVLGDENVELFLEKYRMLSKLYPDAAKGCNAGYISGDNKRVFNTDKLTDHHALIPLAPLPEGVKGVNEKLRKVYNAVLERFFNVVKEPYLYNVTTVTAASEDGKYTFKASGKTVIQNGWKSKDDNSDEEEKEETQKLPGLMTGDELLVSEASVIKKLKSPKKHFTNATLLALMENPKGEDETKGKLAGLGTPATRANIISILLSRGYIIQQKQNLLITDKGKFLIENITKIPSLADFISISTTTKWEQQLQDEPEKFLINIKDFLKTEIPKIEIKSTWENQGLGKCPLCKKGNILPGKKNYYCSNWQNGCKFVIWFNHNGATINENDARNLLLGKTTGTKKLKKKDGSTYSAKLQMEFENGTVKLQPVFDKK